LRDLLIRTLTEILKDRVGEVDGEGDLFHGAS